MSACLAHSALAPQPRTLRHSYGSAPLVSKDLFEWADHVAIVDVQHFARAVPIVQLAVEGARAAAIVD